MSNNETTDEFMVYGRAGNRRVDLEAKLRDAMSGAAASGDASADLQQIKALALAASPGPWHASDAYADNGAFSGIDINADDGTVLLSEDSGPGQKDAEFIAAANPAVVLDLIARIERSASGATASGDEQTQYREWQKDMRGLGMAESAWMERARRADVSAATKPTADLSQLMRYGLTIHEEGFDYMAQRDEGNWVKFADVQSLLATKPAAPADRNDVLEEAANLCEEMEGDMFDQYKGRGKHAPNNPYRAEPYMNGQSDGAGQCAIAIRKLMRNPAAAPAAPMASADAVIEALTEAEKIARCHDLGTPDGHAIADAIAALRTKADDVQGADK